MRFLVQVTAGNQWLVERAIRTEIISEFWEEYGSATTTSGTLIDSLHVEHEEPKTSLIDASPQALKEPKPEAAATVASLAASSNDDADNADASVINAGNPEKELDSDVLEQELSSEEPEETAKPDHSLRGFFRTDYYPNRWQKILSFGGRVRMSTSLLLGALLLLSLFKVMTVEPSENWQNSSGWLSPSTATSTAVTTSETSAPVSTPSMTVPTTVEETPTMESNVETQQETSTPATATPQRADTIEPTEEATSQEETTASQTQSPAVEAPTAVQETVAPTSTP